MGKFFFGLDLGQSSDPSALSITERMTRELYHLRHLQRYKLGTPYPEIVDDVGRVLALPLMVGNATLIVDATGVGRPVTDMFKATGLTPVAITITGGASVSTDGRGSYQVPKRDLVSNLTVLLQAGRLKIAEGMAEREALIRELLAFRVSVTEAAHETYGGRSGAHDDLVLSVALGCWYAVTYGTPQIFLSEPSPEENQIKQMTYDPFRGIR